MEALSLQSVIDNTLSQAQNAKAGSFNNLAKAKNDEDMQKTAKDFEAFFIAQMMEQMFQSIPTDGMFGGGNAEKIYRSMMINEYGKQIANNGGVGIADNVVRFMIEIQNQANNPSLMETSNE